MKTRLLLSLLFFSFVSIQMHAQTDDRMAPQQGFSFKKLLPNYKKVAITTEFADVDTTYVMPANAMDSILAKDILEQPKSVTGAYILCPGLYQMVCKSYCIKAGTYGPSKGDSYLYAPLKGPKENLMKTMLINAEKKGNFAQHDIQLLLWAIIAKTKFKDLNPHLQFVLMSLLSAKEIVDFNDGAIGFIPDVMIDQALQGMPASVRAIITAENQMRKMFGDAQRSYAEFERMAVITGMAPVDRPTFKRGRWSKHPLGYYIRYLPEGYNKTTVQVYVPIAPKGVPSDYQEQDLNNNDCSFQVEFNAIGSVAVPSNTQSQRLLQSNEKYTGT